jgi:hypothetical protein
MPKFWVLIFGLALIGGAADSASAQYRGGPKAVAAAERAARTAAAEVGDSTRIAVYVAPSATENPDEFQVIRKFGARKVIRLQAGTYCINPDPKINVNKAVPIATVEWGASLVGDEGDIVQWQANGACPRGWFTVLTFRFNSETKVFERKDAAAFTFVVP